MKVNSVVDLLNILERSVASSIFRGHADSEWILEPSIARLEPSKIDIIYDGWPGIEIAILDEFEKYATPHMNVEPSSKLEWMMHAQHFGVPTRLLDWTTNPLKALFFAVSDARKHDTDGAFFTLTPGEYWSSSKYADCNINTLSVFQPIHINKRIVAQDGCFSLFPIPKGKDDFIPLKEGLRPVENCISLDKIIIPSSSKNKIFHELRKLGISFQSLFPSLSGVAKNIRGKFGAI